MTMRTKEYVFYALLLTGAFMMPIVQMGSGVWSGDDGWWPYVVKRWMWMLPFVFVLALHIFVLIPILLEKRRTGWYVLLTVALVAAFMTCSELTHRHFGPHMSGKEPPRHMVAPSRGMQPDDLPPPLPPGVGRDAGRRGGYTRVGIHRITVMDTFIVVLLLGCSLAIKLMLRRYEDMHRMEQMERERLRQELAQLKAQVSPHFFMNSLNNIHGMIETDPPQAQEMILQLSGMMRYVLYEGGQTMIPLTREIDFLCNYLALMRVRYSEERVAIGYAFPDRADAASVCIPPLLFIIFVENAFKHGVDYRKRSFVDVEMSMGRGTVTLRCTNSMRSAEERDTPGGVGLTNLRKRLDILYGDRYTMQTSEKYNQYSVTLTIPYNDEHQMHCGG